MQIFKFLTISIISLIILIPYNKAEGGVLLKSDSLKIGDEAPAFVMRNLFTNEGSFCEIIQVKP